MIKVNEVAFFCYPVTDIKRARSFYEGILGLTPTMITEKPGMSWVEYEIGAATLSIGICPRLVALQRRRQRRPRSR